MSMQSILSASQSMSRLQIMQSAKSQMQSQASILRTESKLDGGNAKKDEQALSLDEKSNKLMNDLMNQVSNVNETITPEEEAKAKEEETAKEPRTDKLELSYSTTDQSGAVSCANVAVGEPATYKADGSKEPFVAENNRVVKSS